MDVYQEQNVTVTMSCIDPLSLVANHASTTIIDGIYSTTPSSHFDVSAVTTIVQSGIIFDITTISRLFGSQSFNYIFSRLNDIYHDNIYHKLSNNDLKMIKSYNIDKNIIKNEHNSSHYPPLCGSFILTSGTSFTHLLAPSHTNTHFFPQLSHCSEIYVQQLSHPYQPSSLSLPQPCVLVSLLDLSTIPSSKSPLMKNSELSKNLHKNQQNKESILPNTPYTAIQPSIAHFMNDKSNDWYTGWPTTTHVEALHLSRIQQKMINIGENSPNIVKNQQFLSQNGGIYNLNKLKYPTIPSSYPENNHTTLFSDPIHLNNTKGTTKRHYTPTTLITPPTPSPFMVALLYTPYHTPSSHFSMRQLMYFPLYSSYIRPIYHRNEYISHRVDENKSKKEKKLNNTVDGPISCQKLYKSAENNIHLHNITDKHPKHPLNPPNNPQKPSKNGNNRSTMDTTTITTPIGPLSTIYNISNSFSSVSPTLFSQSYTKGCITSIFSSFPCFSPGTFNENVSRIVRSYEPSKKILKTVDIQLFSVDLKALPGSEGSLILTPIKNTHNGDNPHKLDNIKKNGLYSACSLQSHTTLYSLAPIGMLLPPLWSIEGNHTEKSLISPVGQANDGRDIQTITFPVEIIEKNNEILTISAEDNNGNDSISKTHAPMVLSNANRAYNRVFRQTNQLSTSSSFDNSSSQRIMDISVPLYSWQTRLPSFSGHMALFILFSDIFAAFDIIFTQICEQFENVGKNQPNLLKTGQNNEENIDFYSLITPPSSRWANQYPRR